MALKCGFFNSLSGDRKYNAEDLSSIFDGVINDGVFQSIGNTMRTIPGTGMQVLVQTGKAWFNHTYTVLDENYPLTIGAADPSLKRIDAVVLEVNHNTANRINTIKIVKGTPAASPSKPSTNSPTSDTCAHHVLAYVTINGGAKSITVSDIDIRVGQSDCPFVTGIVQVANVSELYAKWQAQFNSDLASWKKKFDDWYNDISVKVSEQVVTNLQQQITANKNSISTLTTNVNNKLDKTADKASSSEATAGTNNTKYMTPSTVKAAIQNLMNSSGFGKVQVVSYTGTGTYGESNPTTVTFSFTPKVVMFFGAIYYKDTSAYRYTTELYLSGLNFSLSSSNSITDLCQRLPLIDISDIGNSYTEILCMSDIMGVAGRGFYLKKSGTSITFYANGNISGAGDPVSNDFKHSVLALS